jgi:hypothetical protein
LHGKVLRHVQFMSVSSSDHFRAGDSGALSVVKGNKRLTRLAGTSF